MMAYADFTFYTNTYKGRILNSSDFEVLSERATDYISAFSYGMTDSSDLTADEELLLKKCTCAVADVLSECGVSDLSTGIKSSESVGSWHIGYAVQPDDRAKQIGTTSSAVFSKVQLYLGRTRLLYYGVD